MNRQVDAYLKRQKQWRAELTALREIFLETGLTEELKWGHPCYTLDGKNIALLHGFKEYCAVLFNKGALLKDPKGVLVQQTKNVQSARQLRFTDLAEVKKLAKTVKYDPKKAKALLKEAGVAEGTKVTVLVPAQPPYDAIADVIQPQLEAVGLAPEINKTTSYATDASRLKPDMATVSLDPSLFNLVFGGSESPLNFCAWNDPEVTAAMQATQDPTKSEAELKQAWADFQKVALDQSANIVTNAQGLLVAHSDKVKNMTIVNAPYGPQLYGVYMTK